MLRIGTRQLDGLTELSLQGRLAGAWVAEVRQALAALDLPSSLVTLDLSEVRYVDEAGERLLREVASSGIRIGLRSGFVAALLEERGREP